MAYFQGLWLLVSGSVFFQNLFDTLKSMLYPLSPPRIHGIHATVDGRNPAPVEVGSLFLYTSQVDVWDFFHINSRNLRCSYFFSSKDCLA